MLIKRLSEVFKSASFKCFLVIKSTDEIKLCKGHTSRYARELSFSRFFAVDFSLRKWKYLGQGGDGRTEREDEASPDSRQNACERCPKFVSKFRQRCSVLPRVSTLLG